jgi:hypothetical protein
MNQAAEEIIVLGKDSIVQLALELIDEEVEVENFSQIKIMTDGRTVYVLFRNPIKYLPLNSVYYFDFNVEVIDKVVTYGPVSNGVFEPEKKVPVFKETKEIKGNIQFVMDAINKSDEVGSINTDNFEDEMEIREYESYYSILIVSEFQESSYKIEKKSGKIYDSEHAHLLPPPVFEEENKYEFKELK